MSEAPDAAAPAAPAAPATLAGSSIFSNAAIISFATHAGPHNLIIDDLTDYFWGFVGQTVHTYLCVKDVRSWDNIAKRNNNYAKVVDTPVIKMTHVSGTRELRGLQSNLLIILGHGHLDTKHIPASILFYDDCQYDGLNYDEVILYADSAKMAHSNSTPMKLVAGHSDLLMLFCCYSKQIVDKYLTDMTRDVHKPHVSVNAQGDPIHSPKKQKTHHTPETRQTLETQDVLYFEIDTPLLLCIDVLLLLMISLADGRYEIPNTSPDKCVTPIILRIMQMVRLFDDDAEGFWTFLQEVGCVVLLENVKKMQQQATDWPKNKYFRVGGHKFTMVFDDELKQELLAGLRALTLVTWTAAAGVDETLTRSVRGNNPPDIEFDAPAKDGSNQHVDKFLRDYHRKKHSKPYCVVSAAAPPEPLLALLAQLRTLDVEKAEPSIALDPTRNLFCVNATKTRAPRIPY